MITDIHTHVWPDKVAEKAGEFLSEYYGWKTVAVPSVDNLFRSMDDNGIDRSVIASVATRPDQVNHINKWLFSLKSERIVKFASIHPFYSEWSDELKRIKDNASGIKIHPEFQGFYLDDEKVFPVYEQIQKIKLPVLVHCGYEFNDQNTLHAGPRQIINLKKYFPELKFIGAHMGGYRMWDRDDLRDGVIGSDIYIDTSSSVSVMGRDRACELLQKHDVNKILFGTDFPIGNPAKDLDFFKSLNLAASDSDRIMNLNFETLLEK